MSESELLERLKSERSNPELYDRLGDLYAGDPQLADKALRNYLEASRLLLGGGGDKRDRAGRAAAILGKALPIASDRDSVLFRLAEALESAGRNADAEAAYRDILARSPADERPFFYLALLERIAQLAPLDLEHRRRTAGTRERLGMNASAAHELAEVARLEARHGSGSRALADVTAALALLPGAAELVEARAEVLEVLGDREGATRSWLEAADAYRSAGDEDRGRLTAERALGPSEAHPLAPGTMSGSALVVAADPVLTTHLESLLGALGLHRVTGRAFPPPGLPAQLRLVVLATDALTGGSAWDAAAAIRHRTHPDLPVVVIESLGRPLGEEDRAVLTAAAIAIVDASAPLAALARPLLAAAAATPVEFGDGNEPLLPFEDLPSPASLPARAAEARPDRGGHDPRAEGSASRWRDNDQHLATLQGDLARREAEIDSLRAELQAWRESRVGEEILETRIHRLESRLAAAERELGARAAAVATLSAERDAAAAALAEHERAEPARIAASAAQQRQRDEAAAAHAAESARMRDDLAAAERRHAAALAAREREYDEVVATHTAEVARVRHDQVAAERRHAAAVADHERQRDDLVAAHATEIARLGRERCASEESASSERDRLRAELAADRAAAAIRISALEASAEAAERRLLAAAAIEQARRLALTELTARGLHQLAGERDRAVADARTESAAHAATATRLSAAESVCTVASAAAAAAAGERDAARARSGELSDALARAGDEGLRLRQDLERSRLRVFELGEEGAGLAAAVAGAAAEAAARDADHATERAELARRLAALEGEVPALQRALSAATAGQVEAAAAAQSLADRARADRAASEQQAQALGRERAEREAASAESLRLVAELHAARDRAIALDREHGELAARLVTAAAEAAQARHQRERESGESNHLRAALAELSEQIAGHRAESARERREAAQVASERDQLATAAGLAEERVRGLEAALGQATSEGTGRERDRLRLEQDLGNARAEVEHWRLQAERVAGRSLWQRLLDRVLPIDPFAQGLLVGFLAVAIALAALTAWPRRAGFPERATAVVPERAEPVARANPDAAPGAAASPVVTSGTTLSTASEAAAPTPPLRPIDLAEYAAIERGLVRREERSQYRLTAKLRTPLEVRGFYAYQATLKGWDAARLGVEIGNAETSRYHFDRKTYVDVLVENLGSSGPFDVNAIAQGFTLSAAGAEIRGIVSSHEEPRVVTSSTGGAPRIQAVTLSLEFAQPSSIPLTLAFRLPGGGDSLATLTWEASVP